MATPRSRSIVRSAHPATQGFPMPRATSAACEAMPPCAVRMPFAAIRPWMSSGLVSQRTRMTSSPSRPRASAVSASKTTWPDAAPGRGGEAPGGDVVGRAGSIIGCRRWSICAGSMRAIASSRSSSPSPTIATAARDRCGGGALGGSGLEQVQPALLDGELDVLDVAVVPLEPLNGPLELGEGGREEAAHVVERSRHAGCPPRRPRPAR